jgi:hypothetical protein
VGAQSRQSAKLFSSRRNWDSPNPSPAGECAPPPSGSWGGAHLLAREGVGQSQFRRGDMLCGTIYIYVLCGWGSPNSNEGTYTVVLYIYKYFVIYIISYYFGYYCVCVCGY